MKGYLFLSLAMAAFFVSNLSAGICASSTDCTLTLDQGNSSGGFGSGNFGTVHLTLNTVTDVATIDVKMTGGFLISGGNGFAGAFGFVDNLGGGLTIGGFSSASYSGSLSDATDDLHFDGFGFANDAAASSHPIGAAGIPEVSFTVKKGTQLTDVNDLLHLFSPAGGDGAAYFVVDASTGTGNTGLISVTHGSAVPEPTSYLPLVGTAFGLIVFLHHRRSRSVAS
jgi:hypothetical protein